VDFVGNLGPTPTIMEGTLIVYICPDNEDTKLVPLAWLDGGCRRPTAETDLEGIDVKLLEIRGRLDK